ncbi:hypothetical protein EDD15DRAFT_2193493 [Pisolithus albus]|nr:hypothetical protein EDD15DRAFT_2193493 [Pisolithus albus]
MVIDRQKLTMIIASKANLHPGQIILDSQIQRCTSKQKQADDEALQQAKVAESATTQEAYTHGKHKKKTVEVGTGLGTTKETNQEKEEFGPKAREKTILKLRSATG